MTRLDDLRTRRILVVCVWVFGAVVVLGAAILGPWSFNPDRLNSLTSVQLPTRDQPSPPSQQPAEAPPATTSGWTGGRWIVWALLGVLVIISAIVIYRVVRRLWAQRTRPVARTPVTDQAGEIAAVIEPELPVLHRGVEQARAHLAGIADPTDAVIAAWLALEDAAARSGVPRDPAQTPTEFTSVVLAQLGPDTSAIATLLALYQRTRFGHLPVTAADVDAASGALDRLAEAWSAVRR